MIRLLNNTNYTSKVNKFKIELILQVLKKQVFLKLYSFQHSSNLLFISDPQHRAYVWTSVCDLASFESKLN